MASPVSSQRERITHEQQHRSGKAKTMLAKEARSIRMNSKKRAKRRS